MGNRWDTEEILNELIAKVQSLGGIVAYEPAPSGAGRHLGTLDGNVIVLYRGTTNFEAWFTLAHLFGHLVQRTKPTDRMYAAIELVRRPPGPLTEAEQELLFDHEYEAAQLGAALIESASWLGLVDLEEYARMFMADYHYLTALLSTGEGGVEEFNRVLEAEPRTAPIPPLYELVNLDTNPPQPAPYVIVI